MFVIGEIVVRFVYGDSVSLFPRYHTSADYGEFRLRRTRANLVFHHKSEDGRWRYETNDRGFRNFVNFEYQKPDGVIRILSLGDSHTLGYEVRQDFTFSAISNKYLQARGIRSEVINAGVSGFSTAEELLFLENEGIKYEPDFVVLAFYRNDIEDNIRTGLFELGENGDLKVASKEYIPGVRIQDLIYAMPGTKWLGENSYFYSILFNATWQFARNRLTKTRSGESVEMAVATKQDPSDYQEMLSVELVRRIASFCDDKEIKLIIVDIPAFDDNDTVFSSLPDGLRTGIESLADGFVDTTGLLADFLGAAEIHVPHGQRHISEFTHTLIGVEIGKHVTENLASENLVN